MIYAVGGRDDTTELSSAERYSPQTNSWQPVVAMTSRRSGVSTDNLNRLIVLFCCFTYQVNSYDHDGTVSSPNHTFFPGQA